MFPNAWKFINLLQTRWAKNKIALDGQELNATDLIKQVTLTNEEVVPTSGNKSKPWVYYISEPLKENVKL
jgi:hypothetical protein